MKKYLLLILTVLLTTLFSFGQNNYKTVKGYVVDKNGNPIPGAEVAPDGGGNTAITDADGSFILQVHPLLQKLTAKYAGMKSRTNKVDYENDMIFRLKKKNNHPFFLNLNFGAYRIDVDRTHNHYKPVDIGFMFGQLGNWGWYAKPMYISNGIFSSSKDLTGLQLSGGAIKSLKGEKFYIYFGGGVGRLSMDYYKPIYNGTFNYLFWYYHWSNWANIILWEGVADVGFIYKPSSHFNLSVGVSGMVGKKNSWGINPQLGLGYVF